MAKIDYIAPVEAAHGRLFGQKSKVGFAKRQFQNGNGEKVAFSVLYGKRSTKPSTDELAARSLFSRRAAAVKTRKKNPATYATDFAAYQKSSYKSFNKYLWAEVAKEITE